METTLKVALVHRDNPRLVEARMVGWWSYTVPEFIVTHVPVGRGFILNRELYRDYDLIFYEDGKLYGEFAGSGPPVVYLVVDSTLSDEHYRTRHDQAQQVDLILVDFDRLDRFTDVGKPVRRLGYCVNDKLMRDHGQCKEIDVGSFQGWTPERERAVKLLQELAMSRGLAFANGIHNGIDYALMMNRSKIVLNVNRNPETRAHRVFDAMACRSCLLTSPLPEVSGEVREAGVHYLEFDDPDWLTKIIPHLLDSGEWEGIAGAGYALVREQHTWSVRARELRQILSEVLGL